MPPPFPLRSPILLQVPQTEVLRFRGALKYPEPQPAAHLPQLLRWSLTELAPHQRFGSQLSSSKARAARRLLARTRFPSCDAGRDLDPQPSRTSCGTACPDRHPGAGTPWPSSIQGAFRRPDCPGSSSLARWFGTPPLVQARVLTWPRLLDVFFFFSFSICHVASLVCLFCFLLKRLFVRERMVGLLPTSCKLLPSYPIPSKLADLCGFS